MSIRFLLFALVMPGIAAADQALQTLERYKQRLDDAMANLTAAEVEDVASLLDVAAVVQRGALPSLISRRWSSNACARSLSATRYNQKSTNRRFSTLRTASQVLRIS